MIVYDLCHITRRNGDSLFLEPLFLGFYSSYERVQSAIQHYVTQPGFRDDAKGFSIRRREVCGRVVDSTVYEAIVYFHSEDYELEYVIEKGLFGDEATARAVLDVYAEDNREMSVDPELVREDMVIRRSLNKREWEEGFVF